MSLGHGSSVVRNGLVLNLDASNVKSNRKVSSPNLELNPEDMTTWVSPVGGNTNTILNAITAPDGTTTADKVFETTTANDIHIFGHTSFLVSGTVYTLSFFAKAGERFIIGAGSNNGLGSCVVNLNTQTVLSGAATITPYGNGWYRISTILVPGGGRGVYMGICDNTGSNVYTGDGASGFYVWGFQVELGTVLTPYYPATAWYDVSTSLRTATLIDGVVYNAANLSMSFNGTGGYATVAMTDQLLYTGFTVSIIFKYNQTGPNDNLISWGFGAFNNPSSAWEIRIRGPGPVEFSPGVVAAGNTVPTRTSYSPSTALNGRIAVIDISYIANGMCVMYENGQIKATNNYAGVGLYTNTQTLQIGHGTDSYFPGNIYSTKIYNRALSSTEITQNFEAVRGRYGI